MEILNPSKHFLRVPDKFFGDFICRDEVVRQGAALLYLHLFHKAYKSGCCWPSQRTLAKLCKCSERSIQHHLRQLVVLQYIRIERQEGRNVYYLLLSQRARGFINQAMFEQDGDTDQGAKSSPAPTQHLRKGGENSSPDLRDLKSINTPLSPLPEQRPRENASSRTPFLAAAGHPLPVSEGRGDSFSSGKKQQNGAAPYGANSGGAERFPRWSCCWRHWIASALQRAGTGNRAALCRNW